MGCALLFVSTAALSVVGQQADDTASVEQLTEHPSEAWSPRPSEPWTPRPSEPWSPRIAMAPSKPASEPTATPPTEDLPEPKEQLTSGGVVAPAESASPYAPSCIPAPPLEAGPCAPPCNGTPRYYDCPEVDRWHVQSHFLRSLGRYGLIAPPTPGVDSAHSPFLGSVPYGPPPYEMPANTMFAAPPFPEGASQTAPPDTPVANCPSPPPCTDGRAQPAPYSTDDFTPDPFLDQLPYDSCDAASVYGDKHLNPTQRPLIEWGMPLYLGGPVPPPSTEFGETNPSLQRFYVYGDYRAAAAYNAQNGQDQGVIANRLNLEWDWWLTSTERFHMFTGPFQRNNDFMRVAFDDGSAQFEDELDFFDADTDTAFFEGDLGYMLGGLMGHYASFDLPVTVGLIPLLFQNGVWMEDAIVGTAMTIPARNSALLDWSNFDVTFFTGFNQVTSPAFENSTSAGHVVGVTTFIDAKGGYIEAGYAFLDDTIESERSYHNVGLSYTRRYLNLVSNSMRVILNAGQEGPQDERTAEGVLLLAENSFLSPWPYNVIPYVNFFAGFDDPQSVARAGAAGGVLRNTGILFESDNLTGYPTLDATGNNSAGAALGIDLLAPEFTHQLILETAVLQAYGDSADRNAPGNQYGVGARYQVPISNATLLRFDVMHGWLQNTDDVSGARAEFRWKF